MPLTRTKPLLLLLTRATSHSRLTYKCPSRPSDKVKRRVKCCAPQMQTKRQPWCTPTFPAVMSKGTLLLSYRLVPKPLIILLLLLLAAPTSAVRPSLQPMPCLMAPFCPKLVGHVLLVYAPVSRAYLIGESPLALLSLSLRLTRCTFNTTLTMWHLLYHSKPCSSPSPITLIMRLHLSRPQPLSISPLL